MSRITQAVILAAGKGTRLAPITDWTPKSLVPFMGRPLLEHAAAHVVEAGVTRVAVNAYHLGDAVARYVGDVLARRYPSVQWHVSREEELLGTGGALKGLAKWLKPEPFLVVNADAVFAESLEALVRAHSIGGADATWMVTREPRYAPLRVVCKTVDSTLECIAPSAVEHGVTFCGVHVCEPALLDVLPPGPSCVVRDGYLPWVKEGARVGLWETQRFWADTGTPERYLDAHTRALGAMERWSVLGLCSR